MLMKIGTFIKKKIFQDMPTHLVQMYLYFGMRMPMSGLLKTIAVMQIQSIEV